MKKYTKEQILNFEPSQWVFRRSSGYAGYDRIGYEGDESKRIYENDYSERVRLKSQYDYDYKLIASFRLDQLPFGEYPDYHIQEFLNKKYFL